MTEGIQGDFLGQVSNKGEATKEELVLDLDLYLVWKEALGLC